MNKVTKLYRNRIALIFDFDDTLAPSTCHTLLHQMEIDLDAFEEMWVQPLINAGMACTLYAWL